jgi:hypothetical protein
MEQKRIISIAQYIAAVSSTIDQMSLIKLHNELLKIQQVVDTLIMDTFECFDDSSRQLVERLQVTAIRCRDTFMTKLGLVN